MLFTFLTPLPGVYGLSCCLMTNCVALLLCGKERVSEGGYGFNAVFVGLALGFFCPDGFHLLLPLSLLVFFVTVCTEVVGERLGVPFFAFPFLFCLWMLFLVAHQRGDMVGFDLWGEAARTQMPSTFLSASLAVEEVSRVFLPPAVQLFFKSFGVVFFQPSFLVGLAVAVALLCFSRTAFLFSVVGFFPAYFLFAQVGLDLYGLPFLHYGFNFILTAMAVGCCYAVPSRSSLLWVLLLSPVLFLMVVASVRFFSLFFLPSFSFPFCAVSAACILLLRRRGTSALPVLAYYKEDSPESSLYSYERSRAGVPVSDGLMASLPFMGEWTVSQGFDGEHTHKALWRHAWDFVVEDEKGLQYKGLGDCPTDYYCFGKPVTAAAPGVVAALLDGVDDNPIGRVDSLRNWGNYIVLKHADGLFSSICHLKKGSLACKVGDVVERGALLAVCGNSGYSPFPHLHFQFQAYPQMGCPTIDHRIGSYCVGGGTLALLSRPRKGETVSNAVSDEALSVAYSFFDGEEVRVESERYGTEVWRVRRDAWGCFYFERVAAKKARAWFVKDGVSFRFVRYEGTASCALYHFYRSNFHLPFVQGVSLCDQFPLQRFDGGGVMFLQDLFAPFYIFMRVSYEVKVTPASSESLFRRLVLGRSVGEVNYVTSYNYHKIKEIEVTEQNKVWKILFLA